MNGNDFIVIGVDSLGFYFSRRSIVHIVNIFYIQFENIRDD